MGAPRCRPDQGSQRQPVWHHGLASGHEFGGALGPPLDNIFSFFPPAKTPGAAATRCADRWRLFRRHLRRARRPHSRLAAHRARAGTIAGSLQGTEPAGQGRRPCSARAPGRNPPRQGAASHRCRMGGKGPGPAGDPQAQHCRCDGLAARCRQGRRPAVARAAVAAQDTGGAAGAGHRRPAAPRAGAARSGGAAGPAHRGAVHQALARCAGRARHAARRCRPLAGAGPATEQRCQLGQRGPALSAAAGGIAQPTAGGVGGVPDGAGPGRCGRRSRPCAAGPKPDPEVLAQATELVRAALATLEKATAEGHGKASAGAAAALRAVLKAQGKHIDDKLEQQVHAALVAAGELEGWQRWSTDQVREDLVAKAEALITRPEGQTLGGRKMQETLRHLRDQWKQADQGGAPNHALWKRFAEACNAAHKVVELWLDNVGSEAAEHKAQRLALIEELKDWAQQPPAASGDWKAVHRALQQFGDRWREGGHLGEKIVAELQALWKQALALAAAPLEAALKESLARRQAMIEEANALGAAATLRIDAVKALQQRWQAEAQTVPLERKHE